MRRAESDRSLTKGPVVPTPPCCPWWSSKYGLSQYVSSWINNAGSTKKNSILDLSFWCLKDEDMNEIVKRSDRSVLHLCFRGCGELTDKGIRYLAEHWSMRTSMQDNRVSSLSSCTTNTGKGISRVSTIGNDARLASHLNRNLIRLDLSGCIQLTDVACEAIGFYFTRLECLDVSNCTVVGDRGLIHVMDGCKYLQEIHLGNLYRLRDEGLAHVRRNLVLMKLLRRINLSGCMGFTNEGISNLLDSDPAPGVIRYIDLSSTNLELGIGMNTNCKVIKLRNMPRILDSTFSKIAAGCKDLQYIDVSGTRGISDYFFVYLFKGCTRLKSINLSNCHTLTDDAFKFIESSAGSRMQELFLTNCENLTRISFTAIAHSFPSLEVINLEGIPKVCDPSVISVAKSCHKLRKLILCKKRPGASTGSSPMLRIGAKSIITLAQNCPDLRILHCDCCSRIDDVSVIALAKGCSHLEELSFKQCYKLTDRSLVIIGRYCHQLRLIDISSCKEMTDDGVIEMCRRCRHLEEVNFSNLRLTDNAITTLSYHNSEHLREVLLRNCYLITDVALNALLSSCRNLERLDVSGVDLLTDGAFFDVYVHRLRHYTFGGTNVSEHRASSLANHSWYGYRVPGKSVIKSMYPSAIVHRQHQKYITFLFNQQLVIYCILRKYITKKRIGKRRFIRAIASQMIQRSYRTYIRNIRLEERIILRRHKKSLDRIISSLRTRINRRVYLEYRWASIQIQRYIRGYRQRIKFRQQLKLKARLAKHFADIARSKEEIEPVYREFICDSWRRLLLGLITFEGIRKKTLVTRVQRSWRARCQRRRTLKMKFAFWGESMFKELHIRAGEQFRSAIKIQRYWRQYRKHLFMLMKFLQEYEKEKLFQTSASIVANFVHKSCMTLKGRRILESMKKVRDAEIADNCASVKIQCWYRTLYSTWLMRVKRKLVHRWAVMVIHKVKLASAIIIQKQYRSLKRIHEIRQAGHIISSNLSHLFQIYQAKKHVQRRRHFLAALRLQSWGRGAICQRRLASVLFAASRIQRMWRYSKARSVFKNLYREGTILQAKTNAMEKEKHRRTRIERKIAALFANTKRDAAMIIQKQYRQHLKWNREEEERMMMQRSEELRRKQEADRLNDILRNKQESRKLKAVTKKLVKKAMTNITTRVNNLSTLMVVSEYKNRRKEHLQKIDTAVELVRYNESLKLNENKATSVLQNSTLTKYRQSLQRIFGKNVWFDKKCEKVMFFYLLWPEDINHFRRLWVDTLDFKKEEQVTVHDFFDHVSEPQTVYGLWLFEAAGIKNESNSLFHLSFSAYISMICHSAMLNKNDLMKILFSSSIQCKGRDYLSLEEWTKLLKVMLSNEKIRYPIRSAVNAYGTFASKDVYERSVLYYSDFVRIIRQSCPFVLTPMLRLHQKIKACHLGDSFWRSKAREIQVTQEAMLNRENQKHV